MCATSGAFSSFGELYDLAWWTKQPTDASRPPTCSVHNAEEIPSGNFAGQSVFELCFMCLSTLKSSAWPISVRERLGLLLVALTSSQQHRRRRRRRRALNYALLLFRCKCPDLWANAATRLLRVCLSEPTPCRLIAPCFELPPPTSYSSPTRTWQCATLTTFSKPFCCGVPHNCPPTSPLITSGSCCLLGHITSTSPGLRNLLAGYHTPVNAAILHCGASNMKNANKNEKVIKVKVMGIIT